MNKLQDVTSELQFHGLEVYQDLERPWLYVGFCDNYLYEIATWMRARKVMQLVHLAVLEMQLGYDVTR